LSEIKTTEVKTEPIAKIPQVTKEIIPTEVQTAVIESNLVTRNKKIPKTIKGIENIKVTSNTTNDKAKPKYKFKCQYFCRIINVTTETTENNETFRLPNITDDNNIEMTTNNVSETSNVHRRTMKQLPSENPVPKTKKLHPKLNILQERELEKHSPKL